jgi:hypothetical protein
MNSGRQEPLVAIGDVVGVEDRIGHGQELARFREQRVETAAFFRADRHERRERKERRKLGHLRQERILVHEPIDLVERHERCRSLWKKTNHRAIGLGRAPGFDDHERRIDIGQTLGDGSGSCDR